MRNIYGRAQKLSRVIVRALKSSCLRLVPSTIFLLCPQCLISTSNGNSVLLEIRNGWGVAM